MSESLAQYSALMVMEKEYGAGQDAALPQVRARPLPARPRHASWSRSCRSSWSRTSGYIHYRKGSVVMYALRDYIGEERAQPGAGPVPRGHEVPAAAVHQLAWSSWPSCAKDVPADKQALLDDMFRTITLFENHAEDSTHRTRADGTLPRDRRGTRRRSCGPTARAWRPRCLSTTGSTSASSPTARSRARPWRSPCTWPSTTSRVMTSRSRSWSPRSPSGPGSTPTTSSSTAARTTTSRHSRSRGGAGSLPAGQS